MLFDCTLIPVDCQKCGYIFDAQMLDVRLGCQVFCPACKSLTIFVDEDASAHAAFKQVDQDVKDLMESIGGGS